MEWLTEKKDKFVQWFQSTTDSIIDFFKESRSTLDEWVNYQPGEGKPGRKPAPANQNKPGKNITLSPDQNQPIIQRGLVNRIEVKFEKSDKERER